MDIGKNIKKARLSKNFTQEELAKRIGVSKNAVSNYENGVSTPKLEILFAIMTVLEVDANYIYDWNGVRYCDDPWHQDLIDDYWAGNDEVRLMIVAQNGLDRRVESDYFRILRKANINLSLSPHEREVIIAYRAKSDMQAAVDRLLLLPAPAAPEIKWAARGKRVSQDGPIDEDDLEQAIKSTPSET